MVRSAVRVCVRTRPTATFPEDAIRVDSISKTVSVFRRKDDAQGRVNNQQENWGFTFDDLLHNESQETVYDRCCAPIVDTVLKGYNGTVMCYGQTGAGKTFTITGSLQNYRFRGLAPRAIAHVFREVASRPDEAISVRISYLEIYNETLYDLLSPLPAVEQPELHVQDDGTGGITVRGLTQHLVHTEEEALSMLFEGETNRSIAEHTLNKASTRSHCVFTVHIESRSRVESAYDVVTSKLHLVDLAGSERVKKTNSEGQIFREATYINKSLSFLEQVVIALSDARRDHVPFRQTALTHVLRGALGGNCKTVLIANIWCELAHLEETISTLKFATRMRRVSTDVRQNVQHDPAHLVKRYEREIKSLKQELAMHDMLQNRGRVQYDPYTEEQRFELQKSVRAYVAGEIEELEIVNVRHVHEIFGQFKAYAKTLLHAHEAHSGDAAAENAANASRESAPHSNVPALGGDIGKDAHDGVMLVGSDEGMGGGNTGAFGIGQVPDDAKPVSADPDSAGAFERAAKSARRHVRGNSARRSSRDADDNDGIGAEGSNEDRADLLGNEQEPPRAASRHFADNTATPPRSQVFDRFRTGSGHELANALDENKNTLKEKKRHAKDLALQVNTAKRAIDDLKAAIDDKRAARNAHERDDSEEEIIDEEEYDLFRSLKEQKVEYKQSFEDLKMVRSEIEYVSHLVEQCRQKLYLEFEEWYRAQYAPAEETHGNASAETREESAPNGDEELDYGERFEKMAQEKVMSEDPDAVAFYNARRTKLTTLLKSPTRATVSTKPTSKTLQTSRFVSS